LLYFETGRGSGGDLFSGRPVESRVSVRAEDDLDVRAFFTVPSLDAAPASRAEIDDFVVLILRL
jgi:hypothetical protein